MQKLIEFNENQNTPFYLPSHLEALKHKCEYFDVPDFETKIQRHDNPHYWLQQDIVQIKNFQYRFFNNIILTGETIPQVKVFTHFLLEFFRFNNYFGNNKINKLRLTFLKYLNQQNFYHTSLKTNINIYNTKIPPHLTFNILTK